MLHYKQYSPNDYKANTMELLSQGIGNWTGISEIYDGRGKFIGNVSDQRSITQNNDGTYTVNVNIVGPIMLNGQYNIKISPDHHSYQGDVHVGYAEQYNNELLASNNYWSQWGLSERNFVIVSPETHTQLSLSLLSRGDQLIYMLVGEYYDDNSPVKIPVTMGIPDDRHDDPTAGRETILMHRAGTWSGLVTVFDENLDLMKHGIHYTENMRVRKNQLIITTEGGLFTPMKRTFHMTTNDWQAWSEPGDVVGTYNLAGGRALSGHLHYVGAERRVWRREVITSDGNHKAILHFIYHGDKRVGVHYGMLTFKKT